MFGNGFQIVPRRLTLGFQLADLSTYFLPIGLGTSTQTAKIRVQVCRLAALLQYDCAEMLKQRGLVDRILDLGDSRQVVQIEAFGLKWARKGKS